MKQLSRTLNSRVSSVGFISDKGIIRWVRLACWLLRYNPAQPLMLSRRILQLKGRSGILFTVKYLKECLRVVQHFVGGTIIRSSEGLIVGLTGGLPTIIPGPLRLLVRQGDPESIRMVLTLFSLVRVLKCPGELKLSTITDPFNGCYETLPLAELQVTLRGFIHKYSVPKRLLDKLKLYRSGSAGPNSRSSFLGMAYDFAAWERHPELLQKLKRFCELLGDSSFANKLFPSDKAFWSKDISPDKELYLGRLALKEEGAGKVRVFAITDVVTQSVMLPLHDWIFSILKGIPMDGTFDQGAPLRRLNDLKKKGEITDGFHSFDLSAATDRLPISLQKDILSLWWGEEFASLWRDIMIDRDWILRYSKGTSPYISSDIRARYSVGQPMGALSSWGMLALTHHMVVQVSARRVGLTNFTHYAILGDDVVIANNLVSKVYLQLMEDLGVVINLSKTLSSENTFEFAKRLVRNGEDLTPVGPKNLVLAMKTPKGLASLFVDMAMKGSKVWEEKEVREMYKEKIPGVRNNLREKLLFHVIGPLNLVPSSTGLSSVFTLDSSQIGDKGPVLLDRIGDSLRDFLEEHQLGVWRKARQAIQDVESWNLSDDLEACNTYFRSEIVEPLLEEYHNYFKEQSKIRPENPFKPGFGIGPLIYTPIYISHYVSKMSKEALKTKAVPIFNPFEPERVVLPFNLIQAQEKIFSDARITGYRTYIGLRADLYKSPRINRFF